MQILIFLHYIHLIQKQIIRFCSIKLYKSRKDLIKTRRQAFTVLLILEELDPWVDQQWINMSPITMQRIPVGWVTTF